MNLPLERILPVTLATLAGGCQAWPSHCDVDQQQAVEERISVTLAENRSLKRDLEAAQAKIKALTQIEHQLGAQTPHNQGKE